jgi:hypothetical protein
VILVRPLVRLLSFVLLVALALGGLAAAVACLGGGDGAPSLPWLARLVSLPALEHTVGRFLAALERPGGAIAVVAALAGLAAVAVGLALIAGVLVGRRERRVTLAGDPSIDARRGALGHAARALTEQARGVTAGRVRVRPGRRSGGVLRVRADRPRTSDPAAVKAAVEQELTPLTEPFGLRARVQSRLGDAGSRVQ